MKKIFIWLFGAATGVLASVIMIAWAMVVDPKSFINVAETYIDE